MRVASPAEGAPWYTQFWPWFLIALPATSIVVSVAALVLAVRNADSLVRDDWYTRGLAINRDLGRAQEAVRLGLGATLTVDPARAELVVRLDGDDGSGLEIELQLQLQHPTDARRDRVLHLVRRVPGTYHAALDRELRGRWYVSLAPPSGLWRLAAPLTFEPGVAARLTPPT